MLKRYLFFLFLFIASLTGCGVNISGSGTNAILQEYGGSLTGKTGVNATTDTTTAQGRYVELELVNDKLETAFPKLSIPASNCAYLFYRALSQAERKMYDHIRITIRGKDNSYSHSYRIKELEVVEMATSKFDEVGQLLKNEKYDDLLRQLDINYFPPVDFEKFKLKLEGLDKQFGRTGGFKLQGFEFFDHDSHGEKKRMLTMYSLMTMQRTQGLVTLSIDPSASITSPNIVGFNL